MAMKIIFGVLMAAYIIPGVIFGFQKLFAQKNKIDCFKKWGYPLWFMRLLGLAEVVGCSLMLFNSTRLYGIAIFPVILIGAVYTHVKFKEPKKEAMTPVFVGLHLLVIFLFTFWI